MPLAGRAAAAAAGGLLVLVAVSSVTVTLIVSAGQQPADAVGGPDGRLGV